MQSSEGGPKGASGLPSRSRESYPRRHRLAKNSDYRRTYNRGRKVRVSSATVFLLERDPRRPRTDGEHPRSRLGITVTRKVGTAVVRNRLKRRIREIFRRHSFSLPGGWDIVVNMRPGAEDMPYSLLEREIVGALRVIARGSR